VNYATIEKESLAVVIALEKFRSSLLNYKVIVLTDHVALKYLMKKYDSKSRLFRWVLLQEIDLKIKDKARLANVVVDHISHLGPEATSSEELPIDDSFSDEQLFPIFQQAIRYIPTSYPMVC